MEPNHPTLSALIKLHAEIGGKIIDNKKQAKKLAQDMQHVEAVIRMFAPGYNVASIAAKRRNKSNPWFKRGTLYRSALDVLREAGEPLTARQIAERVLARRHVTNATTKQVRDLQAGIHSSLRNHKGGGVVIAGEGLPRRWTLAPHGRI